MSADERFDALRCRFADGTTEADYQKFAFARNLSANKIGMLVGIPLFSLYAILDFVNLSDPMNAVLTRIMAAAISFAVVFSFRWKIVARNHEMWTAFVVSILGAAMLLIIWGEPSLENSYYVGLIQAGVMLSFLIRISFDRAMTPLILMLIGFFVAVHRKEDSQEALLQSMILFTMFAICAFGIYLSERARRLDFLKSRTIALQNQKLNEMLADVQQDNARKVAAMNLLVHFVKTPIHQIVGFTDVIKRQIEGFGPAIGRNESLESATFIQSASRDLSRNVSKLLAYYRLDEKVSTGLDLIELDALILDHLDRLDAPPALKLEKVAIVNRRDIVSIALQTMIERYVDNEESAALVEVRLERVETAATLIFIDKGAAVSGEETQRRCRRNRCVANAAMTPTSGPRAGEMSRWPS